MSAASDYARQLAVMAESERVVLAERFGEELDYSPASLAILDRRLSETTSVGAMADGEKTALAVYVGEIIRRSVGAEWGEDEHFGVHLREIGGVNLMALPINWVEKRLERGAAHAFSAKYSLLIDRLQGGAKPDEAAVPFVAGRRTEDEAGLEEILVRAPAIMFYLIAAADGHVDAEESAGFREFLATRLDMPSPLLQRCAQVMLPRLNLYLAYLASPDFDRAEALAELREVLDTRHAEDALAFKQSLVLLGEKVAEASGGGFFGLGEKVSDEEHSALKEVASALGLK